jgi:UDP:flavonoid glycosyltransferase YjiC (YdhE family)
MTGHLLPLLPIADAAVAAGHEVAVLSAKDVTDQVAPLTVLAAGPNQSTMVDEALRRTGAHPAYPGPSTIEYFASVRIDFGLDEALAQARGFAPDLIVCEEVDFLGPLVATILGVPWAENTVGAPLPEELAGGLKQRSLANYEARSLTPAPRIALLDSYPDVLLGPGRRPDADRITVRPVANEHGGSAYTPPAFASDRPRVLVTLGTTVTVAVPEAKDELAAMVSAVIEAGCDVIVTEGAELLPADLDRDRVRTVGFVPLSKLLPEVDLVVSAGGTGTLLSALSQGIPLVLRPYIADQPQNAALAEAAGAAVAIENPADAGTAARRVLDDPAYRTAAKAVAAELASTGSPAEALDELIARCAPLTTT